jgi:eukaryotic-like serine/threonine-protein kinase
MGSRYGRDEIAVVRSRIDRAGIVPGKPPPMFEDTPPESFEDAPTIDSGNSTSSARPRKRIGRYTVRRVIASGGMGTVLEAIQDEPRRIVALKIMKGGIETPDALRRFQFEAQLLARLRHPGIAQIYEAGTHDDGSGPMPYFAMEYIPNAKPITEAADARRMGLRERLELFAKVCDAVHHGHQKGIVHRDIKPGNILVDSDGAPHVIDFGVARASDSDTASPESQTEVGTLVGSVAYMSPEQFDADPHDLDMRSDVYALGVVLYELLAGKRPYDVPKGRIHEAARIVREVEPVPLRRIRSDVPIDVETIVAKALQKDREQRYQSAFGLAEDLRRFLRGDPIAAAPPSAAYQLRTFARRNKPLMAAVAAAFVALLAGGAIVTSLYVRSERSRAMAEKERARAEAAIEFFTSSLESVDPEDYMHTPTISDLAMAMSARIEGAFPDDPLVEAELQRTIAWGYQSQLDWKEIQIHLERALALRKQAGETSGHKLLTLYSDLQTIYEVRGELPEKVEASREIVRLLEQMEGADAPTTLQSRYDLAADLAATSRLADAAEVAQGALEGRRRTLGDTDPATLESEAQIAWLQIVRGDLASAETSNRELLGRCRSALGETHGLTRQMRSQLAATLILENKVADAVAVYGNRAMPAEVDVEKRYQGVPDLRAGNELMVFWETWCPFSQRTVPRLEDLHLRYRNLDVLGLTHTRPPSSDAEVMRFIESKGLTFPVVKTGRETSAYFDVHGTPWIVIGHRGRLVWENRMQTPDVLLDQIVERIERAAG